jgi:hypothetical protein
VLPNLIVIGATKCGTSSLHRYLDLHPEISMSSVKELRFFSGETWSRGLGWYESQFGKAPVRGESSPAYSRYPAVPSVPERMASIVPHAKLIYLLRDPVERLLSHYRYLRFALQGDWPPLDDLLRHYERDTIVAQSRYAYQLDRYLQHFPLSQIMVVDASRLDHDRVPTVQRVFAFLGVRNDFVSPEFDRRHNETEGPQPNAAGLRILALERSLGLRGSRIARKVAPHSLTRRLFHHRPEIPQPHADPVLLEEVRAFLREDVQRLSVVTGLRFDSWPILASPRASEAEPTSAR